MTTVHDYRLPGWVGAADLVIAVSLSGATEETLSAAEDAGAPGLPPAGGGEPLDSPARGRGRAGPGYAYPRLTASTARCRGRCLWGLSVPLVVVGSRLGLFSMPAEAYEAAAAELERVKRTCSF